MPYRSAYSPLQRNPILIIIQDAYIITSIIRVSCGNKTMWEPKTLYWDFKVGLGTLGLRFELRFRVWGLGLLGCSNFSI